MIQGKDGKYRWVYEVKLMRNFAILWEVYRALIITCGITFFIIACISVCADGVDAFSGFPFDIKFIAIFVAGMLVLGFLGYVLYAAISGWKYVIRFTMTDKEIIHEQMPRQVKKAQAISMITVLAGLASKSPGTIGTGMLAARTTSVSTFKDVKKIKAVRRSNLIKVNESLSRNQIYVEEQEFDFVYQFLCQHCPNAKHE